MWLQCACSVCGAFIRCSLYQVTLASSYTRDTCNKRRYRLRVKSRSLSLYQYPIGLPAVDYRSSIPLVHWRRQTALPLPGANDFRLVCHILNRTVQGCVFLRSVSYTTLVYSQLLKEVNDFVDKWLGAFNAQLLSLRGDAVVRFFLTVDERKISRLQVFSTKIT